jgi:hypothetical protein
MKKKPQTKIPAAHTAITNCTFTSEPEPIESVRLRAEAIKAAADALGKIADALKGNLQSSPLLTINQKP